MHITKLFSKAVLLSSLFLISVWTMAHEGHDHGMQQQHAEHQHMSNHQMPQGHMMGHAPMPEAEYTPHRQGEHAHMNHAEHCQTAQAKNQADQKDSTDSKNQDLKGDNHAHH